MKDLHTHEWKYNEAKQVTIMHPIQRLWSVVRFCTDCFEVEVVDLKARPLDN